ncbi:methyltransferase-like protein 27 [Cheilinus undulatus]|uniref:methyltransferase-like protein 27 n=1 Tax=Cheilinus undulatus TaxID=241271 RepID=UPI001BD22B9E|nr:methyltransferase-like protein 27 [Cheilinus undulatus]XP_041658083.1 methyltransferase-like protein 27 [Cheilinus undulatus]
MSSTQKTFGSVSEVVRSIRANTNPGEKMRRYDAWADTYEQDLSILDYHAPSLVTDIISSHFTGDCEAAVVLDVACGTGLVAKQMKHAGFVHFVGIDGSALMLEEAKKKELYQELKQCILVQEPLPVQSGSYDVVTICGALTVDHVAISVIRELCNACKPGGLICMTCRHGEDNLEYKAALEREHKQMEEEGLWSCVAVTEVKNWSRSVTDAGGSYISGSIYLYKKL